MFSLKMDLYQLVPKNLKNKLRSCFSMLSKSDMMETDPFHVMGRNLGRGMQ
jgi:hypothetical protein